MEITILGHKLRVEIILLCMIIGAFIALNVWCSCSGGVKEGFHSAARIGGAAIDYAMGDGVKGSWDVHDGSVSDSSAWYKHLESNKVGMVPPLPEGQLDMLNGTPSSADCCPSTYTTSTGCICETPEQARYLASRGGNRTFSTNY